jgi:PAS domain S-box-containing protein
LTFHIDVYYYFIGAMGGDGLIPNQGVGSFMKFERDPILGIVGFAVEKLLMAIPYEEPIRDILERIGLELGARRAIVGRIEQAVDGTYLVRIRHEWVSPGFEPFMDDSLLRDIPYRDLILPDWEEVLKGKRPIHADPKDISGRIGQALRLTGSESITIIPILSGEELWGILIIDKRIAEGEWLEAISIMANLIGTAIRRCEVERSLEEEKYLMDTLMENIPDNIYFKDSESRFIRISRALANYFGLKDPSEAVGKTDFDFFSEEHARQAYEDEQMVMRTGEPIIGKEEKETWPDGHVTWVSTTKVPLRDKDGRIIGTFGISRDITDRKRAEEALKVSLEKYSVLFSSSPLLFARIDREGRIWDVNPAMAQSIGLPVESIVGRKVSDIFPPDIAMERMSYILKALDEWEVQHWEDERGGRYFYNILVPVRIPGEGESVQVIAQDITERKGVERKYRSIFENALEGIFQIAPWGWFMEANPALARILGYSSPEDLISSVSSIRDQIFKDPACYDDLLRLVKEKGSVRGFKCRMKRKDGDEIWVSVNIRAVRDEMGDVVYYEGTMEEERDS